MDKAVEALNLVKNFGNIIALNGTYFEVKDGEIFGLLDTAREMMRVRKGSAPDNSKTDQPTDDPAGALEPQYR